MGCINILNGFSNNQHPAQDNAINLLVYNLMPNRLETEHQIISVLKRTPHNFNITFCRMASHHFRHADGGIIQKYATLAEIEQNHFDALLVTGAPLDQKKFTEVDYWEEFKKLLIWRKTHVKTSLFNCWSAWAAGSLDQILSGQALSNKICGVYRSNGFTMPHSRYFKIPTKAVSKSARILAEDAQIGATIVFDPRHNSYYLAGHFEYGTRTLAEEYQRDIQRGLNPQVPANYFDNQQRPHNTWQQSATKFYRQWLQQFSTN
ncbi:homoserine O-acetyltransferase/O-succinyltransferase family protein [Convivina intestini]|uniref:Homoserine O-acetyltransferase n=1 Tax=Convivina intestini TaxID=1505726 RepID=A0A2U1D9I9_9LACO|nr:homoserine O-succinyltransferase [Convivina intestini]PVY84343.1 homoserine O-succinyltransferase [Convivina intestini]CAH1857036.1 Homoserine O-acetyltransferase [Convivina intestini]SDC06481.1 homoserine O-succinyltransferase [Leuconostocaceae bacterium R-53105]